MNRWMFTILITLLLFTACTPTRSFKDEEYMTFESGIYSEYEGIVDISLGYVKPTLTFSIVYEEDELDKFEVVNEFVGFLEEDEWIKNLRDEVYLLDIYVFFYYETKNNKIERFMSEYYVPGTTVYQNDDDNQIDDFMTWYHNDTEYTIGDGLTGANNTNKLK